MILLVLENPFPWQRAAGAPEASRAGVERDTKNDGCRAFGVEQWSQALLPSLAATLPGIALLLFHIRALYFVVSGQVEFLLASSSVLTSGSCVPSPSGFGEASFSY